MSSPFVKRKQVADLLVRRGAALNEKNKELLTPLHVATDCNHADAVELLLKHGAKVNALDSHGQTGQWGWGGQWGGRAVGWMRGQSWGRGRVGVGEKGDGGRGMAGCCSYRCGLKYLGSDG